METDENQRLNEEQHKTFFNAFLNSDIGTTYMDKLSDLVAAGGNRLIIDIGDLRNFDNQVTQRIIADPNEYLSGFRSAMRGVIAGLSGDRKLRHDVEYQIGFDGNFATHHMGPRELSSEFIRSIVRIDGIVTRCSLVRPKIFKSVHYCPATNKTITREYRDHITSDARNLPTGSAYPTTDEANNPLSTEYGYSVYTDYQHLAIQEMPERSPAGQMPRSVEVILEHDLVDTAKPGDRVSVIGVFRALPNKTQSSTSGVFRTVIVANNIKLIGKDAISFSQLSEKDQENIASFKKSKDILNILTRSIAPSIYGHDNVKRAILLMLLGGIEKNLENGTHLRGDVNILMVGDPSTAKSQLLRFVLHVAPLAINTTGRGSSGVGLTAAVTQDPDTGERRLEAGAMVLADRGVVCIDEFDKMNDSDRVAIHEVMEQQTVTIAKAGIHASLNARCSVVAAANPVFGRYDASKSAQTNVNLPESLLSRFDLLFVILDTIDPTNDLRISDHVINMHRFRSATGQAEHNAESIDDNLGVGLEDQQAGFDGETPMFEKDVPAHGNSRRIKVFTLAFLKKYIRYAKLVVKPQLTQEVSEYLASQYTELRARAQEARTAPVTARTLETMIRLSTAHAKARLSDKVELEDAESAVSLLKFALFYDDSGSQLAGSKKKKRDPNADSDDDDNDNDMGDDFFGDDDDEDDDDDDDDMGGNNDDDGKRSSASGKSSKHGSTKSGGAGGNKNNKSPAKRGRPASQGSQSPNVRSPSKTAELPKSPAPRGVFNFDMTSPVSIRARGPSGSQAGSTESPSVAASRSPSARARPQRARPEVLRDVQLMIGNIFQKRPQTTYITVADVVSAFNGKLSETEVRSALPEMVDQSQIMLNNNQIYKL